MKMQTILGIRAALGVAILTVSLGAWPQASVSVAASSPTSAKEMRQANRALRRKVYAAFAKQKEIDAGNIGVTAKNGAITLTGTVAEASGIDTAGQLAKDVPGVTSVTNKIAVQRPLGE